MARIPSKRGDPVGISGFQVGHSLDLGNRCRTLCKRSKFQLPLLECLKVKSAPNLLLYGITRNATMRIKIKIALLKPLNFCC